ncbi:MAG: hypothetical protein RBJ76_25220 [Stenomitos frigidus ULC029]
MPERSHHFLNQPFASASDRTTFIQQMRGFLKTDQAAPTDAQVEAMLEKRRVEKYLT